MLIHLDLPLPKNRNHFAAHLDMVDIEEGVNSTPMDLELRIDVAFIDRDGMPGHAVTRSSRTMPVDEEGLGQLKLALNTCYSMLGCQVVGLQVSMEMARSIRGFGQRTKIRRVK